MSALGSSSFSKVSTGFTTDSKAMVPVSIQGMGGQVQKMSIFDSMQEAFFEIRDGVDNLAVVFTDKISALNEHLAFRFESLNQTLMRIAGISDEDLDLEEQQTKFAKDKAIEDDRDKSLRDDNKGDGSSILDTLKERFNSLLDLLAPQSEIAKVGLLGLLTLGIMTQLPKLEKALEGVFKFTSDKLIPFIDGIFDIKDDETGEFKWTNILGVGLGAYVAAKLVPSLVGMAFKVPGGARVLGYAALAAWAMGSAIAKVGDVVAAQEWTKLDGATDSKLANSIGAALGGNIEGGLMNAFTNGSKMAGTFALIGAGIGSVVPVVGTIVGALIGGAIGLTVGGIMGFFGGGKIAKFMESMGTFVSDAFNSMVSGIRNFFMDEEVSTPDGIYTKRSMLGEAKDIMAADFKLMGEQLKDFFYDDEGNLFGINFDFLKDLLPSIEDIARTIYEALPQWARPDTLNEKLAEVEEDLQTEMAKPTEGIFKDTQDPSRIKRLTKKKNKIIAEIEEKYPGMIKQSSSNSDTIIANDGSAIAQTTELKKNIAIQKGSMSGMGTGGNVAVIDNSKKSNDKTIIGGNTIQGPVRVDGMSSGDAFMSYLYRQQN